MATYKDLIQQRQDLDRQIREARESEISQAIAEVRRIVADFDLQPNDVFPASARSTTRAAGGSRASTGKVPAKYRDPVSGATWTGRGKAPRWIQDQDRSKFAI